MEYIKPTLGESSIFKTIIKEDKVSDKEIKQQLTKKPTRLRKSDYIKVIREIRKQ